MKIIVSIMLAFFCLTGFGQKIGKITKVIDGNTFEVEMKTGEKKHETVVLYGIDAPELQQQYGKASQGHLKKMLYAEVEIEYKNRDPKQNMVAMVYHTDKKGNKTCLNYDLVEQGYAWKFQHVNDKKLEQLEKKARKNRAGLWKNANPIPPWEYRKNNK